MRLSPSKGLAGPPTSGGPATFPVMAENKGRFTSETARAAALKSNEKQAAGEGRRRSRRKLEELTPEQAREQARRTMQGLLDHKDPRVRREAAKYVLDEERADREADAGPVRVVYETRALPPTFEPRAVEGPPLARAIAGDA